MRVDPASRPLNRDRLGMLDREQFATTAFKALDAIQNDQPEEMLLGASVLFAALCARCKVDPQDMHTMALKALRPDPHHKNTNDKLDVIVDFAGLRMMAQDIYA